MIITGRRQAELDIAVKNLGEKATGVRSDVSHLDDLDRLFTAVSERGTGIDVLFANAGGGAFATLEDLTPEDFDRTFGINVRGTVFTVQKALPLLNPGASVIVTGSTSLAVAPPPSACTPPVRRRCGNSAGCGPPNSPTEASG